MSVVRKTIGIGIHVLLFLAALAIFYFGLGVGLAFNPTLGTLLWVAARAVANQVSAQKRGDLPFIVWDSEVPGEALLPGCTAVDIASV